MLDKILRAAVERGASDVHVKSGDVIRARVDGRLVPLTRQALTAEQTRVVAHALVTDEGDRARLDAATDHDCSYALDGAGRFRVNILRQRGAYSAVLRLIPAEVPTLERLGLPPVVARIAEAERGMMLVTGVTGSGKSSTLAAMIRHVNARAEKHIVTLENPIEFLHTDLRASVTQREVGVDVPSFGAGDRGWGGPVSSPPPRRPRSAAAPRAGSGPSCRRTGRACAPRTAPATWATRAA